MHRAEFQKVGILGSKFPENVLKNLGGILSEILKSDVFIHFFVFVDSGPHPVNTWMYYKKLQSQEYIFSLSFDNLKKKKGFDCISKCWYIM